MTEQIARIFDTSDSQVVIFKEYNEQEEPNPYRLVQLCEIKGVSIKCALGYNDKQQRDNYFEKYNQRDAEKLIFLFSMAKEPASKKK